MRWLAEAPTEPATAPAVSALLAAGATLAGLAHTDELAFSLAGVTASYGAVPNPAVPGATTGGSSSGPAAAVAGHAADLDIGTDTAGSIRVPASYRGLYGLRPTHGAISPTGVLPLAPSFDTVGLLSRDPGLLATAAGLLLPPPADQPSVDVLLRPAGQVDAARLATLRLTCVASLGGLPALAMPTMRVGTAPMALTTVGGAGTDHALLDLVNRPGTVEPG